MIFLKTGLTLNYEPGPTEIAHLGECYIEYLIFSGSIPGFGTISTGQWP